MIPTSTYAMADPYRIPRESGDDPNINQMAKATNMYSPRERG